MGGYELHNGGEAQPSGPRPHSNQGHSSGPPSSSNERPPLKRKYHPRASRACELCRVKKLSVTKAGRARFVKIVKSHVFIARVPPKSL